LKSDDYFSIVTEDFVTRLSEKKSELEPILRKTGKKTVAEFLKKRKKKILKVLGKEELSDSKITELRTRLKEYNFLKTLNQKTKIKKDEFEQQLDAWNQKKQQISQIQILIESGVFEKKELSLIKKAEAKLTEEAGNLQNTITEIAPKYSL
jgi:multidrug resistance efflux pump